MQTQQIQFLEQSGLPRPRIGGVPTPLRSGRLRTEPPPLEILDLLRLDKLLS
jgi:hypothetical protein